MDILASGTPPRHRFRPQLAEQQCAPLCVPWQCNVVEMSDHSASEFQSGINALEHSGMDVAFEKYGLDQDSLRPCVRRDRRAWHGRAGKLARVRRINRHAGSTVVRFSPPDMPATQLWQAGPVAVEPRHSEMIRMAKSLDTRSAVVGYDSP